MDIQSQLPVQSSASQSEQPLQTSHNVTNNPEESEDEGLGLNGFSEADNVKDLFKDMAGIVSLKSLRINLQLTAYTSCDKRFEQGLRIITRYLQ